MRTSCLPNIATTTQSIHSSSSSSTESNVTTSFLSIFTQRITFLLFASISIAISTQQRVLRLITLIVPSSSSKSIAKIPFLTSRPVPSRRLARDVLLTLFLLVTPSQSSYQQQISFLHPPPSPYKITISFVSPDDGSVDSRTLIVAPSSARISSSEAREIAGRVRGFCSSYSSTEALEECVGNVLDRVYRTFPQIAERREFGFSGGNNPRGRDLKEYCAVSGNKDPLRCEQIMLNELGYDIPIKPLDSHKVILFWKRVYLVRTSLKHLE